jgi:CHAD domain-containing protein
VPFQLRPRESIGRAIPRLVRGRLAKAIQAVESPASPLADRVHDVRTALKKSRALLQLVRPLLGRRARKEQRRLAAIARRVADLRDAGVLVETFDRLATTFQEQLTPLQAVRARLEDRRARLEQRPDTLRSLRRTGRALARVRRYRKARRAMADAYEQESSLAFHAWRKAVKAHAFQVELLARLCPAYTEGRRDPLAHLGEALGEDHDLVLFEETVRAERGCFDDQSDCERLLALVSVRRRELRLQARLLGERLFAERPSAVRERFRRALHGAWGRSRSRRDRIDHREKPRSREAAGIRIPSF